jgi:rhodanese-related sulfurtransferase
MEPTRITADEVRRQMERGEHPVIIDARSADAWSKASSQAAGAIRVPPDDVPAHVDEIPKGRPVVAYCT